VSPVATVICAGNAPGSPDGVWRRALPLQRWLLLIGAAVLHVALGLAPWPRVINRARVALPLGQLPPILEWRGRVYASPCSSDIACPPWRRCRSPASIDEFETLEPVGSVPRMLGSPLPILTAGGAVPDESFVPSIYVRRSAECYYRLGVMGGP
jgi:hypothetical protein